MITYGASIKKVKVQISNPTLLLEKIFSGVKKWTFRQSLLPYALQLSPSMAYIRGLKKLLLTPRAGRKN